MGTPHPFSKYDEKWLDGRVAGQNATDPIKDEKLNPYSMKGTRSHYVNWLAGFRSGLKERVGIIKGEAWKLPERRSNSKNE